ncbi:hypothetical protein ES705_20771 [subsurface metagenome]
MQRIVLISCVATKLDHPAPAKDLYVSDLFKKSMAYAKSLKPDKVFILSAKHHLMKLDTVIEPYDVTLSNVSPAARMKKPSLKVLNRIEKQAWAKKVIAQLENECDLEQHEIIALAGKSYLEYLAPHIRNLVQPLKGLRPGERKRFLMDNTP